MIRRALIAGLLFAASCGGEPVPDRTPARQPGPELLPPPLVPRGSLVRHAPADPAPGPEPEAQPEPLVITVEPAQANLLTGERALFVATWSDPSRPGVEWSVEGAGFIAADGLYLAPDTPGTFTVRARSVVDPAASDTATVVVRERDVDPPVEVAVLPPELDLLAGETAVFAAVVTGTEEPGVHWSVVDAGGGVIDAAGTYTAPEVPGDYQVLATSVADPTRTAGALVHVSAVPPPVEVSVDPAALEVPAGESRQLTATVTNAEDPRVTWSVLEEGGGTVDGTGLYTAPLTAGTFTVVAVSIADPTRSAQATVDVTAGPEITISIAPAKHELKPYGELQLTATLENAVDPGVEWEVEEQRGGKVDGDGLYTAPGRSGTFHVIARSVQDPTKEARAEIRVSGLDTRIVPEDRRTVWEPGIPGGVPEVTTIFRTIDAEKYGDGETDAFSAIQSALNAAGREAEAKDEGQVVYLPEGTYELSEPLVIEYSHVVLRGAGKGKTILHLSTPDRAIWVGEQYPEYSRTKAIDVTSDVERGATEIEVEDASGFEVGDILALDQVEDGDPLGDSGWVWRFDIWWSMRQSYDEYDNTGIEVNGPDSPDGARPIQQYVEVAAIDGDVLTFANTVHVDFPSEQLPQVWNTRGANTQYVGLEDFTLRGALYDGILLTKTSSYSWVSGVELDGSTDDFQGAHLTLDGFRNVVKRSYIHESSNYWPGGNAYGIVYKGTDCLIEDNVLVLLNKPIVGETAGGGNVIAYNYVDEAILGYEENDWQETGINASHGSFTHNTLIEGNWAPNVGTDATHGNNGWITMFRNHATGQNSSGHATGNLRAVSVDGRNREHTSIGNVLLTPDVDGVTWSTPDEENLEEIAVYRIGTNTWLDEDTMYYGAWDDGLSLELFYRHMDFDYVSEEVYYDPDSDVTDLPDSLYLTKKPAFFGDETWPWVDPLGEDADSRVLTLPAKARYDAGEP